MVEWRHRRITAELMSGDIGMNVKIAFIQLLPEHSLDKNLEIGKNACIEAKEMGADIALFPEMWSDGYYLPQDETELNNLSIDKDSDFINEFRELAAELRMAIGITFLEKNDPRPLNSVIFFDREFPESARILMLKGAELILAPNACPMEINRLSVLRTRAYENMVAVATCNYPEGHPDCNGRSTLFDGVPWLRNEPGSRDMCVFEAPGSAGVYVADLNLDKLRAHRSQDIMGDKYRHPHKYGILADENVRDVIGGDFVHW